MAHDLKLKLTRDLSAPAQSTAGCLSFARLPALEEHARSNVRKAERAVTSMIELRSYRPEDREAVLALQQEAEADLPANVPEGFYDDLEHVGEAYAGGEFLVATAAGTIIGMGGLLSTGEIVRMRVSAPFRRRGIASRLLDALLARAAARGMSRVFLHTLDEQMAARQLYQRAGFREAARGEIHGNAVIGYERPL